MPSRSAAHRKPEPSGRPQGQRLPVCARQRVEVEPGGVGLGEQRRDTAGRGVHRERPLLGLRAVQHHEAEVALRPGDPGQVGIGVAVPVDPARLPAVARDEIKTHPGVGGAGAGVADRAGRHGRVLGVGDEVRLDRGGVGLLVQQRRPVRGPPGAVGPVQLLGRRKLGEAVAQRVAAAAGDLAILAGGKVDDVQVVVAHRGDVAAVGRQARRDPAGTGDGGGPAGGGRHAGKAVGLGDQRGGAVAGQRDIGDAGERHAGALAAGLLGGRQGLRDSVGRGELDLRAGGEIEAVEALAGVARAGAEVEHGAAVRGGLGVAGRTEAAVAGGGQRVEAVLGRAGGLGSAGSGSGSQHRRKDQDRNARLPCQRSPVQRRQGGRAGIQADPCAMQEQGADRTRDPAYPQRLTPRVQVSKIRRPKVPCPS